VVAGRESGVILANDDTLSSGSTRRRARSRRGFTLLEIGVVLAIAVILGVIGIGTFKDFGPRYRLIQASKELKSDLMATRMSAIEENRQTRIKLVRADPEYTDVGAPSDGSWLLQGGNRARNSNRWDTYPLGSSDARVGTVDISAEGNRPREGVSLQPWDRLLGVDRNNPDTITFSPRGWVLNPPGDFGSDGYITLVLINKRAHAADVDDSVQVKISRSGMVRLQSSLGRDLESNTAGTSSTTTVGGAFFGSAHPGSGGRP